MLRLRWEQRKLLADHVPELANFAAGSLTFGQFLSDRPYSPGVAGLGFAIYAVLMGLALRLAKEERNDG